MTETEYYEKSESEKSDLFKGEDQNADCWSDSPSINAFDKDIQFKNEWS
jgi:hypothetical protein